ncbi:unnamed protein product [Nezara viridula]|uniref:Uncharacterized protein n=1 Tax=Nezara viridula TaxID=85310 RepID=A0A9P0H9Y5_NEZVI|nr:unnamed protein product [Nezara viridula]
MDGDSSIKWLLFGYVDERKKRGRLRLRWADEVEADAEKLLDTRAWWTLAQDKEEWRPRIDVAKTHTCPSYTQGIFQSIGLKEFHSYLTLEDKSCPKAESLLQEGLVALKTATRRYARRQIKWIRGRFLRSADRQVPPVYALDATDPSIWDEKVYNPAESIVKFILGTGPPPEQQPLPKEKVTAVKSLKGERLCRVCMRIFIGDHQWEIHQKSKKHQAMLKKKKKQKDEKIVDDIPNC